MFGLWRARFFFLLISLSIIPLGCSKKEVKSSEEDLIRIKEIYAVVNKLKEGYEEKDLSVFLGVMEPPTLDSLDSLKKGLESDFERYSSIHLGFNIDSIIMDKDLASVNLHWEGEWEKKSDKIRFKEKGNALLKIKGEKKMKLSSIEGDNPFGISISKDLISKERGS